MGKTKVVTMGLEGGGATVFGEQRGEQWFFWHEGSSMFLDEKDDDDWKKWKTTPVTELTEALPSIWMDMSPITINPAFLPNLQQIFVTALRQANQRKNDNPDSMQRWRRMLQLQPPEEGESL